MRSKKRLIAMIVMLISVVCLLLLRSHVASAANTSAFTGLQQSFITLTDQASQRQAQSYRPILWIHDQQYTFYSATTEPQHFDANVHPSEQLQAVAAVLPALYAIGVLAWQSPSETDWLQHLQTYQAQLQASLQQVDNIAWRNAAWPEQAQQVQEFVRASLQLAVNFTDKISQAGRYQQQDYQNFAQDYFYSMITSSYLADIAVSTAVMQQLRQWRQQTKAPEWSNVYVVISVDQGRFTRGLTLQTNAAAYMVTQLMSPQWNASQLLLTPDVSSEAQLFATVGDAINAKNFARLTFTTGLEQRVSGLYQSLTTRQTPLALANVKNSVEQYLATGKVDIPTLKLIKFDELPG